MSGGGCPVSRRQMLAGLAGLAPSFAVARPSEGLQLDLSRVAEGETYVANLRDRRILVRHRSPSDIEAARTPVAPLRDPADDHERVQRPAWLVVDGACTHTGCPVWPLPDRNHAFRCFCHGSLYDMSGRVVRGPAQRNLAVPNYRFITEDRIEVMA